MDGIECGFGSEFATSNEMAVRRMTLKGWVALRGLNCSDSEKRKLLQFNVNLFYFMIFRWKMSEFVIVVFQSGLSNMHKLSACMLYVFMLNRKLQMVNEHQIDVKNI